MSKDYLCMHIEKIKDVRTLAKVYRHDFRKADKLPANVDPKKVSDNIAVVSPQQDYSTDFKSRLKELDYYEAHNIRKNAVLAIACVITTPIVVGNNLTQEDANKFAIACKRFIVDNFNLAGDGRSNIMGLMIHMDESHRARRSAA